MQFTRLITLLAITPLLVLGPSRAALADGQLNHPDDPNSWMSAFDKLNALANGYGGPTPEDPNPQIGHPPPDPGMSYDDSDRSLDTTCGERTIDLRTTPNGPGISVTVKVPLFQFAICSQQYYKYQDYIECCCIGDLNFGPGWYTHYVNYLPGPVSCDAARANILTARSTSMQYQGGKPSSWECLPMDDGAACGVPCRDNPLTDSCYDGRGSYCGLSIYAFTQVYCTKKKTGTAFEVRHFILDCNPAKRPAIPVADLVQALDPTIELCADRLQIRFSTRQPNLYGGMQQGYMTQTDGAVFFTPASDIAVPELPPIASLPLSNLVAQAAQFSPTDSGQMNTLIADQAMRQIAGGGLLQVAPNVMALPLPPGIRSECGITPLNYPFPGTVPPCGQTVTSNAVSTELAFSAALATCADAAPGRLVLAWDSDSRQVGGLQLSSPNYELAGLLLSGPLPAKGSAIITNVYPRGNLTVALYGTNLTTGDGILKVITLQNEGSAATAVTNATVTATAGTNNTVTVKFAFDTISNAGTNSIRLPYTIREGNLTVAGVLAAPQAGNQLAFTTEQAGNVVLTIDIPCGMGVATNYLYTTNYVVPGAAPPAIELYSLYPDSVNHRRLNGDVSPSTVIYRIHNPAPGNQSVQYAEVDAESGTILTSGNVTNDFLDLTNNVRETTLTASSTATNALKSAAVNRSARIVVETPRLDLPPVVNNGYLAVLTNQTVTKHAFQGQLFSLNLGLPLYGLTNLYYPENGSITLELDGNNASATGGPGYWTNVLVNSSVPNGWFQSGDLSDPLVLPEGFSTAATEFDVGALQVSQTITNSLATLTVSTVTSNAQIALQRSPDGSNWQLLEARSGNTGVFSNVNVGYNLRLVGTKDRYNSAFHYFGTMPYLDVAADPCTGLAAITVNPAVTNVSLDSPSLHTNLAVSPNLIPDGAGLLRLGPLSLPNDTYTVTATGYGAPLTQTSVLSGSFSYRLQLVGSPGANFIMGHDPVTGQAVYLLEVTGTGNPQIQLVSEKPALAFDPAQPAAVNWRAAGLVEINAQGISQSSEFSTVLVIDNPPNPPCPNLGLPLGVIVRRGTGPAFEIPVSDPKSGNCLQSQNGVVSVFNGP